jgi:hypothetical protein
MISQYFSARGRKMEVVLNRYTPHALLFDDRQIAKALTRPATWKIPDDYATARRTQNSANPVALQNSPISKAIHLMARAACGLPAKSKKKRGFFRLWGQKEKKPNPGQTHTADLWPLPDSSRETDEWAFPESPKVTKTGSR